MLKFLGTAAAEWFPKENVPGGVASFDDTFYPIAPGLNEAEELGWRMEDINDGAEIAEEAMGDLWCNDLNFDKEIRNFDFPNLANHRRKFPAQDDLDLALPSAMTNIAPRSEQYPSMTIDAMNFGKEGLQSAVNTTPPGGTLFVGKGTWKVSGFDCQNINIAIDGGQIQIKSGILRNCVIHDISYRSWELNILTTARPQLGKCIQKRRFEDYAPQQQKPLYPSTDWSSCWDWDALSAIHSPKILDYSSEIPNFI